MLTLAFQGQDLYVGGVFSQIAMDNANPLDAGFVSKWNGTNWFPIGPPGVIIQPSLALPYVTSIAFLGGEVVVAGSLGEVGDLSLNIQGGVGDLARFNGTNWVLFGSGKVRFVSGRVVRPECRRSGHGQRWHKHLPGGNWSRTPPELLANGIACVMPEHGAHRALKEGMDGPVQALLAGWREPLCGRGLFSRRRGGALPAIARWDGSNWNAVGGGLNGTVYALAKFGGKLVAGGDFHGSGNTSPSYLAIWDGNSWSAAGGGVNGPVYSLLVNGGMLCAGGVFSTAGGAAANSIAQWDGANWSTLGSGLQQGELPGAQPASVYCLALLGTNIYAGGRISLAGGAPVAGVACWDGSHWSALASGLGQTIVNVLNVPTARALLAANGNLYVTGENLNLAGSAAVSGLAVWTGAAWQTVAQGLQGYEFELAGAIGSGYALTGFNGEVVIGGAFGVAGGLPASGLAAFLPAVIPPSQPALEYVVSPAGLTISWSAAFLGFTLESSPDFIPQTWAAIPGSSATNSVTFHATGTQSFFRLRQ